MVPSCIHRYVVGVVANGVVAWNWCRRRAGVIMESGEGMVYGGARAVALPRELGSNILEDHCDRSFRRERRGRHCCRSCWGVVRRLATVSNN